MLQRSSEEKSVSQQLHGTHWPWPCVGPSAKMGHPTPGPRRSLSPRSETVVMLVGPHGWVSLSLAKDYRAPETAGGHTFPTPKAVSAAKSNLDRVRHFDCSIQVIDGHFRRQKIKKENKSKKKKSKSPIDPPLPDDIWWPYSLFSHNASPYSHTENAGVTHLSI